ncbi:hypothetical protein U0070_021127 [Myodes glareolus]|uniref:Uncharacterized protein n=1 Tax=Myodes glareolus TaxID=447135 RepID=A0AAW0HE18_MYOGA
MSEFKKIVLLKGLECMEDYHFRIIKSLLRTELHLSENMHNDYDRIKIADKMEETFPKDAGLNKLIEICQEIKDLKGLVENLKKEKAKVKKPNKGKVKTAVKKRKQEEASSSQSLSTDNEPNKNKLSSKKKSKTSTGTEGGKKRKLTQEQSQLPEAPENNTQKDESCLQTPHKPPPIPPSSSSNKKQKRKSIKSESTVKTEISQEEQQLLEFSATSNSSATRELQNHQGLLTTAFSSLSLQILQTPPCLALKTSQGSPAPPCQNFLASPVSDSSIHLNSHFHLIPSSGVQAPQTPRRGKIPKEPAKEEGHHQDPKEVMVLKVTEPFTYDLNDGKRMFHATVATENEFFRVKIFDPDLKNKFIPNKIIAISNYFGKNGFLEIHEASCVSDVDKSRTMNISKTLRQRANATPKIKDLFLQAKGTYVNGEFVVYEKTERDSFIYYGIEDKTEKMDVVVYGRLTSVKCEPGQKLRLVCFELSSSEDKPQLKSARHSNMQVVNVKKKVPQT